MLGIAIRSLHVFRIESPPPLQVKLPLVLSCGLQQQNMKTVTREHETYITVTQSLMASPGASDLMDWLFPFASQTVQPGRLTTHVDIIPAEDIGLSVVPSLWHGCVTQCGREQAPLSSSTIIPSSTGSLIGLDRYLSQGRLLSCRPEVYAFPKQSSKDFAVSSLNHIGASFRRGCSTS